MPWGTWGIRGRGRAPDHDRCPRGRRRRRIPRPRVEWEAGSSGRGHPPRRFRCRRWRRGRCRRGRYRWRRHRNDGDFTSITPTDDTSYHRALHHGSANHGSTNYDSTNHDGSAVCCEPDVLSGLSIDLRYAMERRHDAEPSGSAQPAHGRRNRHDHGSFGRNRTLQLRHSQKYRHASTGIVSRTASPQCGQVSMDSSRTAVMRRPIFRSVPTSARRGR